MVNLKKNSLKKKNKDILDTDLSSLLLDGVWKKIHFELQPKNKLISLRLSEDLLKKIKSKAKEQDLEYQKFIRLVLEQVL